MSSSEVSELSLERIEAILSSDQGIDVQVGYLGERQIYVRSSAGELFNSTIGKPLVRPVDS